MFVPVLDFQLKESRDMTYDGVEKASLLIPKSLQDVHNMNYLTVGNDILSGNASPLIYRS